MTLHFGRHSSRLLPFTRSFTRTGALAFAAGLPLVVGLASCSAASSSPASRIEEDEAASTAEAISTGEYAYFFASRAFGHGYVVQPANGARVACGNVVTDVCPVANVDLAALGTSDADASAILSALDGGWDARALVFVGQVVSEKSTRTLRVVEAWRAPKPLAWSGTIYHVSRAGIACVKAPCEAAHALRVNRWRKWTAPSIDFDFAPPDAECRFLPETNQPCAAPYDLAEAATALPAGLLVAGYRTQSGALLVDQYFVRIGIGGTCDDGGLSYCNPLLACDPPSGLCGGPCATPDHTCRQGRGRGVMPYIRPDVLLPWIAEIDEAAPEY